ncbi:MAG: acetyl-CoA decarbonylase/synthase complex subunit delta [Armatimonadota bacterium]
MNNLELLKENNFPVAEVKFGKDKAIGGEKYFPFLNYDNEKCTKPLVAMEVFDRRYDNMPQALKSSIGEDTASDPVKWAEACEKEYGADAMLIRLLSLLEEGEEDKSLETVKRIKEAVNIPLIIWGAGSRKDTEVLTRAAQLLGGNNILIGPVNQNNVKLMAESSVNNDHGLIIETPLDINIAKQIALSLNNSGVDLNKMVIYPTSGSIGYGFEYAYSISERIRLAGFSGDKYLSLPLISMPGEVVWGLRETNEENPDWGDINKRAYIWEAVTALSYILSGSDIVVVRHPETVKVLKKKIDELSGG